MAGNARDKMSSQNWFFTDKPAKWLEGSHLIHSQNEANPLPRWWQRPLRICIVNLCFIFYRFWTQPVYRTSSLPFSMTSRHCRTKYRWKRHKVHKFLEPISGQTSSLMTCIFFCWTAIANKKADGLTLHNFILPDLPFGPNSYIATHGVSIMILLI